MDSEENQRLIAKLCVLALRDIEQLTDRVVAAIRARAPTMADYPYGQHHADSVFSIRTILEGLRNGQGPTADALAHAEEIGRDRARYGVNLVDAIGGYHVAAAEIWAYLFDQASDQGSDVVAQVSASVAPLWSMISRISISFTAAHAAETTRLAAGKHQVRSRLVALLQEGPLNTGLATTLAAQLGFATDNDFTVLISDHTTPTVADELQDQLALLRGVAHCALDGEARVVVVTQGVEVKDASARMRDVGVHVGVGMTRSGVPGAALSLSDATLAMAAAGPARPVVSFGEDWVVAVFASQSHRIDRLLRGGIDVARTHAHLAEAVVAFALHRFSLTAAASALHVHPNTTKYRLSRWEELTGWDVFTADGLIASTVAIQMAGTG